MRFDAPTLATAWLSVALASGVDKDESSLDRTIALEEYPHGIRLVSTDRFVLLTAWIPDLHASLRTAREPAYDEAPLRTVVAVDDDARGKGLLSYLMKIAKREELADMPAGTRECRVDFDVRIPAGQDADQPLDGLEPTYVLLTIPDVERVYLPVREVAYPDWRPFVLEHESVTTTEIALDPERLSRLSQLRKWNTGPIVWTFGGTSKAAKVDMVESHPHVSGVVMPVRWLLEGEAPRDEQQTAIEPDEVACPVSDCGYVVDATEDGDGALSDVRHHMGSSHGIHDADTALRMIHGLSVPAETSAR